MAFWRKKSNKSDAAPLPPSKTFSELENDPYCETYEDAHEWRASSAQVFFCRSNLDNIPEDWTVDDYVFAISQSRSPGHKDQGQDCLGQGREGNWEVRVLCDGHDRKGHMVALGVCRMMPHIMLRLIVGERSKDQVDDPIPDELVQQAFEECERTVCWTVAGVTQGVFVKIFGGEWNGKVGHVAESVGNGKVIVVIVDEEGYHRSAIETKHLRAARYTGGATCVCLVRNTKTNMCKVGCVGDSRLIVLPSSGFEGDPIFEELDGSIDEDDDAPPPKAVITPCHNVFNEKEIDRLQKGYKGQYEFDGNFLVNPVTKFAIQPTRGFGDFDMWGTGYTNTPEISNTFKLEPGALIFAASDGVFDNHVWQEDEFVTFLSQNKDAGINTRQLVDFIFKETINRSLDGGYVDDISMFCYIAPIKSARSKEKSLEAPILQRQNSKRSQRSKRATVKRDDNSAFTALSQKMQAIQASMSQKDLSKLIANADELETSDEEEDLEKEGEETTAKVGVLLQRFAKKYGHSFDNIEPAELVKGESFRDGQFLRNDDDEDDDDDTVATHEDI